MKREDLLSVNQHMGKLRRLEAAVTAIVHSGGSAFLHIRKGNDDIEVGVPLDRNSILSLLLDDIAREWALLEAMGMERSEPEDAAIAGSLAEAKHLIETKE